MRVRLRSREKSRLLIWWLKWRKKVIVGAIGVGTVAALTFGVWFIISLFRPLSAVECRARLAEGGLASDLQDSGGSVTGTSWGAPGPGGVVIFQELTIVGSGDKCKSVTSEAFSSTDGRKSPARKQLATFTYTPASGVEVKETKAGAPPAHVALARKEFEQITTLLSQPVQRKDE